MKFTNFPAQVGYNLFEFFFIKKFFFQFNKKFIKNISQDCLCKFQIFLSLYS